MTISLGLASSLVFLALIAAPVKSAVYWVHGGVIGGANLDGSGVDPVYFDPAFEYPASTLEHPNRVGCGIALDDSYLYWLGFNSEGSPTTVQVNRVNLEGKAVIETIISGLPLGTCNLTVDKSHIYWTSYNGESSSNAGTIGRANIDGSGIDNSFISHITPSDIAVNDNYIYWVQSQSYIGRATLSGNDVEPHLLYTGLTFSVAVANESLFWGGSDEDIGRANIDGTEVNQHLIATDKRVGNLAANAGHIYWASGHLPGDPPPTIGRASLEGSEVNQNWITTGREWSPSDLTVDSRATLPEIPLWSDPISFGRVRHNRRNGVVFVDVWAREGGELSVISPRIGWKVLKPRTGSPPGSIVRWRLKLWPGGEGIGRRLQAKLRATGRAPITLRVFYSEPGQIPRRARVNLVFRRIKHTHRRSHNSHRRDSHQPS